VKEFRVRFLPADASFLVPEAPFGLRKSDSWLKAPIPLKRMTDASYRSPGAFWGLGQPAGKREALRLRLVFQQIIVDK
jgi:hypothetical protein